MIAPAYHLDEAELSSLRSLVDDAAAETDRDLEEGFRALQARASELQDMEILSLESWDWAKATEDTARQFAKDTAEEAERIVSGAVALSLAPGEEAFVAALRRQIAFTDALRADAEDLAAAARRVQEKSMRRIAAEEHLVEPGVPGFLRAAAEKTDSALELGHVPTADELAKAAAAEDAAALLAERLARMSGRLIRRAAAARDGGEEAFVGGLRRQAANADAARATVEEFAESVRRFRAAGSFLIMTAQGLALAT